MVTHTSYFCVKVPCLQLFLSWYVTKFYRLYMALLTRQFRLISRGHHFRFVLLRWTMRQHTFYTNQVLSVSRELFREMVFATFFGTLPISTITAVLPFIRSMNVHEKINFFWWLALIWILYAAYLLPMADLSGQIHEPRRPANSAKYEQVGYAMQIATRLTLSPTHHWASIWNLDWRRYHCHQFHHFGGLCGVVIRM